MFGSATARLPGAKVVGYKSTEFLVWAMEAWVYLQGQADLDGVVEGRLGQAGLQALVQAGQQRGACLSLPTALQGPEHLRGRPKPSLDAAQMQQRYQKLWRCLWGTGWTQLHSHCKPVRHASSLHEVLHVGSAVCGSSQALKMADSCLMRPGCEMPRGALQQPAHGLCSPAPSDVSLKMQHIHLWQMSCDRKLKFALQGPST